MHGASCQDTPDARVISRAPPLAAASCICLPVSSKIQCHTVPQQWARPSEPMAILTLFTRWGPGWVCVYILCRQQTTAPSRGASRDSLGGKKATGAPTSGKW